MSRPVSAKALRGIAPEQRGRSDANGRGEEAVDLKPGFWATTGIPSAEVIDYTREVLAQATREGRDKVTVSGHVWVFTPLLAPTVAP